MAWYVRKPWFFNSPSTAQPGGGGGGKVLSAIAQHSRAAAAGRRRRRRRRLKTTGSLARSLPLTHPGVKYPVRGYPSLRCCTFSFAGRVARKQTVAFHVLITTSRCRFLQLTSQPNLQFHYDLLLRYSPDRLGRIRSAGIGVRGSQGAPTGTHGAP